MHTHNSHTPPTQARDQTWPTCGGYSWQYNEMQPDLCVARRAKRRVKRKRQKFSLSWSFWPYRVEICVFFRAIDVQQDERRRNVRKRMGCSTLYNNTFLMNHHSWTRQLPVLSHYSHSQNMSAIPASVPLSNVHGIHASPALPHVANTTTTAYPMQTVAQPRYAVYDKPADRRLRPWILLGSVLLGVCIHASN